MAGKSGASTRNRSNTTGNSGNASGPREERGSPARGGRGKHPRAKIFTAPQADRKADSRRKSRSGRQSERG